jgi:hypothetical protein
MNRILAAAVLGACVPLASAQNLKPGLWESTQNMQFAGNPQMQQQMAQAQQQMANMPPEQRKMVEEMMKQRGVSMSVRSGGGMTVKYCITPEMAARKEVPAQRGDCKTSHTPMGPGKMKIAFTCSNPPSSGEGEVTFSSPEAYSMKMVVNTSMQGRPEKVNMDSSARWLGSDCGDIKPFTPPR